MLADSWSNSKDINEVKSMRLEVLLSAMHLEDYKYINTLNITTDCVVVNQCNENGIQSIVDNRRNIKFISTTERGLSRSRNMAVDNADGDICILCDNDVEYVRGYEDIILDQFRDNQEYDIIIFFIDRKLNDSKPYFHKSKKMGYISTLKVFSPEIAFRRKSLQDNNIKFKTDFGAGSQYSMGEENIFLYDCLKKGLKILYVPLQIASLRKEESTWFQGFAKKYFFDKGAVFYEMSNILSIPLILQFAIRKYKLYKDDMSLSNALKYMFEGRLHYLNTLKNR